MREELKAETRAMGRLPAIFEPLSPAARRRIIAWLASVYCGEQVEKAQLTVQDLLGVLEVVGEVKRVVSGAAVRAPGCPPSVPTPPKPSKPLSTPPTSSAGPQGLRKSYRDQRAKVPRAL